MHNKTLAELSKALEDKQLSSQELIQHYCSRIEKYAPSLNCLISFDPDAALSEACNSDKLRAKNQATPLTGLPLIHKDIFCTQGVKTSCGSKMLGNFISPYDASMVKRLKDAGMVMMAKANMDEFAMGSSNENSYFGAVHNPWHINSVPGGSSGGSAAAVAARLTPFATGSDTGGSIRQPAAFCGITGIKPTYGRISRFGMIAFASSLDQAGPMTITAEDAAIVLNAMSAFDEKDATSSNQTVPDFCANLNRDIQGLRVGLPKQFFDPSLQTEIAAATLEAAKQLESLGATLVEIELPMMQHAIACYYVIASAECSSNLSRFDGVRYGYRADEPTNLHDLYCRSRSEGFGDEVKRRLLTGTFALSAGYYDAYYLKAQKVRRLIRDDFINAFNDVDIILGPTTPTTAFKIGENSEDPISMYLSDVYTTPVNLAGLPALSMPAGFDQDNKPIGVQLIGPHFEEARLLNVAHRYQQNSDWHLRCPVDFN